MPPLNLPRELPTQLVPTHSDVIASDTLLALHTRLEKHGPYGRDRGLASRSGSLGKLLTEKVAADGRDSVGVGDGVGAELVEAALARALPPTIDTMLVSISVDILMACQRWL